MLPLLLYQLILLLIPLTLLHGLCGKKKSKSANTGRSNMSAKSAATTPGSKSELAPKAGVGDSAPLPLWEDNKGEAKTLGSGRISIHGVVHNTDTGTGANDQSNGDTGMNNTGEGVNPEKAAPGKLVFSAKDTRKKEKDDGKGNEKEKENQEEQEKEKEIEGTQVTGSHKEAAIKNKEDTVDGTQQTV